MFDAAACVKFALAQVGKKVLWNQDGPDLWDCSGLVNGALMAGGEPDRGKTHTSAALFELAVPVSDVRPGDLAFFGYPTVNHVVLVVSPGGIDPINKAALVSADGATSRITDAFNILPSARVNMHSSIASMSRGFFRGFRRIV